MKWVSYDTPALAEKAQKELKDKLSAPDYIIRAFINRGITSSEQAEEAFGIDAAPLNDPGMFEDMGKAVARVNKAIDNKEKILVFGDYDVDGVTSITILYLFFTKMIGYANVDFYVPSRLEEGYGLNMEALKGIKESGAKLIITVDCGISAADEVRYCAENGMDVIITDHHMAEETPKCAHAVLNPKLSKTYPEKELGGVGVAYKLLCAIADSRKIDIGDRFLDFVALGTVADIVPLTRENRILVRRGLKKMADPTNPGLKALKEAAGLKQGAEVSTYHLGYVLGPRINAAGRLEHANKAVQLFICCDAVEAAQIAGELNKANSERRELMDATEARAVEKLKGSFNPQDDFVIVLYDETWHSGVVGLVASKIVARYNRPAFILTKEEEHGMLHGSARSVQNVDIYEALKAADGQLERYGGHRLAAGVTLLEDNLEHFRRVLNEHLKNTTKLEDFEPQLYIDGEIGNEAILVKDIKTLERLEPWGPGNPKPMFVMKGVDVKDVKYYRANTIKFWAKHMGRVYNFIVFGAGEEMKEKIKQGAVLDAAFAPSINEWNDSESVVLEVKDINLEL